MNSQLPKKNNPDLFQEEEEQESKEANYDANLNAEADEIYENNNDVFTSIEEDQKIIEYQETVNVDIENISSNNKKLKNNI